MTTTHPQHPLGPLGGDGISSLSLTHLAGPVDAPQILIATMHGKEAVLAVPLASLGFQVLLPDDYDTDTLGTFSGDVRRPGTAFEAALEKARRACRATGVPRAVASEGAYRPCQTLFPGARNAELLAFVDLESGVEFVEYLTDVPTRFVKGRVPADITSPEAGVLLAEMGWPAIRALVVPNDPGVGVVLPEQVFKGIGDREALAHAFRICAAHSADGLVHLETDLRAHMNPTRMASVALVCGRLVERLRQEGYCKAPAVAA
ncbi:DUF6671 family protein [Jeongeupia sp. USM3]|uniref:DUF6671 family protein n=1 Tax=Jeongeupia sp. USM3 TaxID=1906741 RepID=UPI00089DDAE9|nr:DUF6671 family protein [Jeongeupia sp. USM3]AOY01924.1 hypothetical protein BJP62_16615 [Jeongeupia sp. USM3]